MIENNINGISNECNFGDYDDGVVMMMYDSVVIKKDDELVKKFYKKGCAKFEYTYNL